MVEIKDVYVLRIRSGGKTSEDGRKRKGRKLYGNSQDEGKRRIVFVIRRLLKMTGRGLGVFIITCAII